jgi:hypothetical protein
MLEGKALGLLSSDSEDWNGTDKFDNSPVMLFHASNFFKQANRRRF